MKLLAISGSLRSASINSAFCRVVARLAPPSMPVTVFAGLGELPLFNPDLEADPPPAVQALRAAVAGAQALVIASPEYAHGISGPLKNALDWLVSFEGAVAKPVVLINTSPRAHHAFDSLREILQTMSTRIVEEASARIPLLGACITEEAMMDAPQVLEAAQAVLRGLERHLSGDDAAGPSFPLA
jgi:NAD(P)H-dependent FMN reductase